MEVLPGIHSIEIQSSTFMGIYPPNVYLVSGKNSALIDSGYDNEKAVSERLEYCRRNMNGAIKLVVITHFHTDHSGGARKIQAATGAKVASYKQDTVISDKKPAGSPVDIDVQDNDVLDVDGLKLRIIATPGHSRSHICVMLESRGILFSGDHILGMGTTVIIPPDGDMAAYIASLRKLLLFDIQFICPGHGPLIKNAARKINELIEHRLERETQVLHGLGQGKTQIEELVRMIYPELDSRLYAMARGQVTAHLKKLEKDGLVASTNLEGKENYSLL